MSETAVQPARLAGQVAFAAEVAGIPFGGGVVLLDRRTDRLLAYNASAAAVWDALAGTGSVLAAREALRNRYRISSDQAERDVGGLIAHWDEQGLLADCRDAAPASQPEPAFDPPAADSPETVQTYMIRGRRIEVSVAHAEVQERLAPVLRHFACADGRRPDARLEIWPAADGEALILRQNGTERLRTALVGEVLGGLFQAMLELAYPDTEWLGAIHGAAVARSGGALLIPGYSGSGKSTLTASLVADGFAYLADDLVALEAPDGRVLPWPTPIGLKRGSWAAVTRIFPELAEVKAERLGAHEVKFLLPPAYDPGERAPVVEALVFPHYRTTTTGAWKKLSPLEALQRLLQDRMWLGHPMTEPGVRRFLQWLETKPCFALSYATFDQARNCLRQAIGTASSALRFD